LPFAATIQGKEPVILEANIFQSTDLFFTLGQAFFQHGPCGA